jgi:hypothetical protein
LQNENNRLTNDFSGQKKAKIILPTPLFSKIEYRVMMRMAIIIEAAGGD